VHCTDGVKDSSANPLRTAKPLVALFVQW